MRTKGGNRPLDRSDSGLCGVPGFRPGTPHVYSGSYLLICMRSADGAGLFNRDGRLAEPYPEEPRTRRRQLLSRTRRSRVRGNGAATR